MGIWDDVLNSIIRIKDWAVGQLIQLVINNLSHLFVNNFRIDRIGKMSNINVDSIKKEISLSLNLKGEDKPIEIKSTYSISNCDGKNTITLDECYTSREWINELLNAYFPANKRAFEIPRGANLIINILGL